MKVKVLEVTCRCGAIASAPEWMFQKGLRCLCGRLLIPDQQNGDPPDPPDPPVNSRRKKKRCGYCNGGPRKWGRR
jgi:hypothetical protein